MVSKITIKTVKVTDVRVPTSDSLLGSDPFHRKPDYSAVLIEIRTDSEFTGNSVAFNIGAGNDWVAYGVRDLAVLLNETSLNDFIESPGALHQKLIEHHQLRWLADGVFRMAVGGLLNALWDLWAKVENKPLWQLLVDLPPETLVDCVDWRYLRDAMTPEQALALLNNGKLRAQQRQAELSTAGVAAYSTAGWLGLSDQQIETSIRRLQNAGFRHFKAKVGANLDQDIERLGFLRSVIGEDACLMTDANQIWGVDEAIEWMRALAQFRPYWIEEPTARDDVLGFCRIREALRPANIGVAAGEQVPSPVIFKQLLASQALTHCQIDATRLAGVNDVIAVILLAAHFKIPVCPHGGGIGLCNMIRHYALWDQIAVSGNSQGRFTEYLDFLQDDVFVQPIETSNGHYRTPTAPGWGLEMHPAFIERHRFPDGPVWAHRSGPVGPAFIA